MSRWPSIFSEISLTSPGLLESEISRKKKMPITFFVLCSHKLYLIAECIPPRKQFVKCPVSLPSAKTWAFTIKFLVRRSRATLSASLGVAATPKRGVLILCWFRSFIASCSCRLNWRTVAAFTANLGILDNIVDMSFCRFFLHRYPLVTSMPSPNADRNFSSYNVDCDLDCTTENVERSLFL